jgi:formylglycine-generating enzyme required for sulfatase activity
MVPFSQRNIGGKLSDGEKVARDHANYHGTGGKDKWDDSTAPIGSFKPNGYGLFDMAGNVSEWCQDEYRSGDTVRRVKRGGSYESKPGFDTYMRVSSRSTNDRTVGFRCVVDVNDVK